MHVRRSCLLCVWMMRCCMCCPLVRLYVRWYAADALPPSRERMRWPMAHAECRGASSRGWSLRHG
jgi:hypothetical protein